MPEVQTRHVLALFLSLLAGPPMGCGSPPWGGDVTGAVTVNGRPLSSGAVTFIGETGQARNAEIQNGRYTVVKPPYGPCTVTVVTAPPVEESTGKAILDARYVELPARYGSPAESGLTVVVTVEPRTFDIPLSK